MSQVTLIVKDIDWNTHRLPMDSDQQKSIIDLAEEHGINLPYSCRSGACFSCCAEVTAGNEHLDREKTGEALIDVEDNECLTCICWVKSQVFESNESVEISLEMLN